MKLENEVLSVDGEHQTLYSLTMSCNLLIGSDNKLGVIVKYTTRKQTRLTNSDKSEPHCQVCGGRMCMLASEFAQFVLQ